MRLLPLAWLSVVLLLGGCGAFQGRGRALSYGRMPFEGADPSGMWSVEGGLPWGSGQTMEVVGPGPVFRVVRRDGAGQALALGVAVAEAGHLFVGYGGSFESCQIAVYQPGAENIEGVWAAGTSLDLGTEEWSGMGVEAPFVGDFRTYGTNPDSHGVYRQRVTVQPEGSGVYGVRWYSGTQEYLGTGFEVGGRFATAAVLTEGSGMTNVMWAQRGYALAAYDLATGSGVAVLRTTPEAPAVVGPEQIRRL